MSHLSAIVWHLRNGEDNAGLTREALAAYLESVNKEAPLQALLRLGKIIGTAGPSDDCDQNLLQEYYDAVDALKKLACELAREAT